MPDISAYDLVEQLWESDLPSPDLLRSIVALEHGALPLLRNLLVREPENEIQEFAQINAAVLLSFLGDQASIPDIVSLVRTIDDEPLDFSTCVGNIGPKAVDPLLDVARDPSARIENRTLALDIARLAALEDSDATARVAETLRDLLTGLIEKGERDNETDREEFFASQIAYGLLDIGDPRDQQILEAAWDAELLYEMWDDRAEIAVEMRRERSDGLETVDRWIATFAQEAEYRKRALNPLPPPEPFKMSLAEAQEIQNSVIQAHLGTFHRSTPKTGRNDPCWCGSGKKYKKCHLSSDESAVIR